MLPAQLMKI